MKNSLINCIENELNSIEGKIDNFDNEFYRIELINDFLGCIRNIKNWDDLDNINFMDMLQQLTLDKSTYTSIISAYEKINDIHNVLKKMGYSTIRLEEISDFEKLKHDLIIILTGILTKLIPRKKTIHILQKVYKLKKEDLQALRENLSDNKLLGSYDLELINSIITKRYSKAEQTEILVWLNNNNNNIKNSIKFKENNQNEHNKIRLDYQSKIYNIFNDNQSIEYFNELLESNISNYINKSPQEFEEELKQMYLQYSNLQKNQFAITGNYFTMDFLHKYLIGLKETLKKLVLEEQLELEEFKLDNSDDTYDKSIIEDEERTISDYQVKIDTCQKMIDFYLTLNKNNEDNCEFTSNDNMLCQEDYDQIITKIKNNTHNIVLFGSLIDRELRGNFINQFKNYDNDVKSDLKDLRKILYYLICTDKIDRLSAKNSNIILEPAKKYHNISGCSTIRASERSDSRLIIKNIAPGIIYVVGIWSKGDEKDYCKMASNIIENIDFDEILSQLNSSDGNNLIIKNLDYAFSIYNKIYQKINGKKSNR